MKWNEIIGQDLLKKQLQDSVAESRISHAQLFVGKCGYGTLPLALAYVSQTLCGSSESCYKHTEQLQHPDLHLSFPSINSEKYDALSSNYIRQFREFILENPYRDINEWYDFLQEEKKQGLISVKEMEIIIERLNLKSYEGGYKVQIIWYAELMNTAAANKFLKILEEPPAKTLFILIAEDEKRILPTILSRCQKVDVHRIKEADIEKALQQRFSLNGEDALKIAFKAEGDWNIACDYVKTNLLQEEFEQYFIRWNRAAVMAPKKTKYLREIVDWSVEVAAWSREKQKSFLKFCSETFRQALLENYQAKKLVNNPLTYENFKWRSFISFVHGSNIEDILKELNEASLHIERNGNPKVIFLDMGVKLTRYLARRQN
ncbi:MAG: DNA polymerase III subunit delta' [Flavobacteriaceae bacterium]|jgi:DNA polymerase-3 subunit delta'|nr:DNA polymerase III subunit delta' [Flavobacteriaceae bacterium]